MAMASSRMKKRKEEINMTNEKTFKFGEKVYCVKKGFILEGKIVGIQTTKADIYKYRYEIDTPLGIDFFIPSDIYRSVKEIQDDVPNWVIRYYGN